MADTKNPETSPAPALWLLSWGTQRAMVRAADANEALGRLLRAHSREVAAYGADNLALDIACRQATADDIDRWLAAGGKAV